VFHSIRELLAVLRFSGFSFEEQVFKSVLSLARHKAARSNNDCEQLVQSLQKAFTLALTIAWSLDNEFEWAWRCKIIWDLLDLPPTLQAEMLKEMQEGSR
jgi:hypothetical protein